MKDVLRKSYDRSAAGYDEEFRPLQRPKYAALLEGAGPAARGEPGPSEDAGAGPLGQASAAAVRGAQEIFIRGSAGPILDLGCGTGLFAEWLAERAARSGAPAPALVGVDIAASMLAIARRRPGVRAAIQADLERLPFRAAAFGAAVAFTSIEIGGAPCGPALREAARVLAPGAPFAVSILKEHAPERVERDLREAGFAPLGPRMDCGQDWGWLCARKRPGAPKRHAEGDA